MSSKMPLMSKTDSCAQNLAMPAPIIESGVSAALSEDLGLIGDITTNATIAANATATAAFVMRERGVVSGLEVARAAFVALDQTCKFTSLANDGDVVNAGMAIARVTGRARAILSGERVALNFLCRMSGIATLTRLYVDAISKTDARIVDTRKTTPHLRAFEKYAVRCGGGHNHRTGLFDAMMIKDNHIVAAGGIEQAILRAREAAGHMISIEVEVDTLSQLEQVLAHVDKVDAVLLDNMSPGDLKRAVDRVAGRIICEASGGVSLDTVREIAKTGIDVISVGALTHSANTLDIGLDFTS